MQCNSVQCSAVQCSTMQFSEVQCSAVKCSEAGKYYSRTNLPLAMHMSACLMHDEKLRVVNHSANHFLSRYYNAPIVSFEITFSMLKLFTPLDYSFVSLQGI